MKKAIIIILGLIVLSAALIVAFPEVRDELHWRWASYKDHPTDYVEYLESWPDGRHPSEAKRLYDERSWGDAKAANRVQAFEKYLLDHPKGKYAQRAREKIEDFHWQEAKEKNTVMSYRRYIDAYPSGRFVTEAKSKYDERSWGDAKAANRVQAFEKYLLDHPKGKYVQQAREKIEDFHWQEAKEKNTVTSYQRYIDAYPTGRFVTEAKSKKEALLQDDTPYLAAQKQGSRQAYETFLSQFPGHKREADARVTLKDMEGRDIVDFLAEKKVEVKAQGSGIKSVGLEIRRLVNHEITVRIPVGTFFVSRRGSVQNMVTTQEKKVVLDRNEWVSVSISAACANRARDIPGREDSFDIQRSPQLKELEKLMPVLQKAGVKFAVQQAAVWIVVDNANYADLGLLVSGFGGFGPRVIRETEAAQAMKLVGDAGIDITKKAIWQDRDKIVKGLQDENLKEWIQQRARK